MRAITRTAVAAVAVSAALAISATPAEAATGQLILRGSGPDIVVQDPPRGCRTVTFGFSEVTNRLDTSVTAYTGFNCTGFSVVVSPGSTMQVGDRHSVLVPS